jgi:AcrR family transcriptional regulator
MRRTAAEAAETRRRVLDAALLSFAERGWERATFEYIAARIGLTRGAVHHHFPAGKDELLRVVLAEHWERYGEVVLAPLGDPDLGAGGRLRSFLIGYLDLLSTDEMFRALATVTTLVAPHAGSVTNAGLEEHSRSLNEWRAALRAVLDPPDVLRPAVDVETAVFVLVNFVVGVNDTAALEPAQLPAGLADRQAVAAAVVAGLIEDGR